MINVLIGMAAGAVLVALGVVLACRIFSSRVRRLRNESEDRMRAELIRQGRDIEAHLKQADIDALNGRIRDLEGQNDDLRKQLSFEVRFAKRLMSGSRVVAMAKGDE